MGKGIRKFVVSRCLAVLSMVAMFLIFLTPMPAQSATVIKLATATVNDVQTEAIKRYAKRIEERTNGRIKTQLFPSAQLGSNQRMIEGVQLGTIQVYVGPPTYLAGLDPRFQTLDAPGVFDDFAHAERTMHDPEFREVFLSLGESKGLKGVMLFLYSHTAFATSKPLRTLDDFRGQKIRVMGSKMEREAVGKLGATAVPIDFSETLPALQQGTVDGIRTGLSIFTSTKLYDIVHYVTETNEAVIPEVMVVSKKWFDSQPPDIQKILIEEGKALEPELNAWTFKFQEKARKLWKENGGEIFTLSASDRNEMMKRLSQTGREVLSEYGCEEMFDLLLKVAENNKN